MLYDFLRWGPALRQTFDAMQNHAPFALSAGNELMPGQKKHARPASLAGNQVKNPCRAEKYAPLHHWQVKEPCLRCIYRAGIFGQPPPDELA